MLKKLSSKDQLPSTNIFWSLLSFSSSI
jgi:hypothetical protein